MKKETIVEVIKRNWREYKDNIAFVSETKQITYGELERYSTAFGMCLKRNGINEKEPVVVAMDRTIECVISIYGILACGAFFVPVNTSDDSARFGKILFDVDARCIVTDYSNYYKVREYQNNYDKMETKIILVGKDNSISVEVDGGIIVEQYETNSGVNVNEYAQCSVNDVACMLYTSGSTGSPKGVLISHTGLINFMYETVELFGFDENTKILSFKPFYFGGAMCDIFCGAYVGGTTYLYERQTIPRKIIEVISKCAATHVSIAPSLIAPLAKSKVFYGCSLPCLKSISFGADVVKSTDVIALKKALPDVRFFNRYGSTETTVAVAAYEVGNLDETQPIPIGKPLKNNSFYILDINNQVAQFGEIGELCIGGAQLMKGYWRDEVLSDEMLRNDIVAGETVYKTGDLVYQNEAGEYIFYGRKDFTINRRGYRINLLEVENAIAESVACAKCVCVAIGKYKTNIVSFVQTESDEDFCEIKTNVAKYIPQYMLPDIFVRIESVVYTPSGKPDRRALVEKYINMKVEHWDERLI